MAPACLVCDDHATAPLGPTRWRCGRCGFVFAESVGPVLGGDYATLYAGPGGRDIDERRRPLYAALLATVPPFGGHRCLDVGCGGGLFVRLAADAGWSAVGIDPAVAAVEGTRFQLLRRDFPGAGAIPGAPFALVTFIGSLNYMRDPVGALRAAHDALEPGGVLLVRVPNVTAHLAAVRLAAALGRHSRIGTWLARGTVLHPRSFSPKALVIALRRAGFPGARVQASAPVPGDPYGSGAPGIDLVKAVVGAVTRGVAIASARRLLWSPSLEARAVRSD